MRRRWWLAAQVSVLALTVWSLARVRSWWLPIVVAALLAVMWPTSRTARGWMRLVKVLAVGAVVGSYVWIEIQPDGGPTPWHLLAIPLLAGAGASVLLLAALGSRRRERFLTYAFGNALLVIGALQTAWWLT